MHPRVSLHPVGFMSESTPAFIESCRGTAPSMWTLAYPHLLGPEVLAQTAGRPLTLKSTTSSVRR